MPDSRRPGPAHSGSISRQATCRGEVNLRAATLKDKAIIFLLLSQGKASSLTSSDFFLLKKKKHGPSLTYHLSYDEGIVTREKG